MTNREYNGYKNFPVCDTHIHIVFPRAVDDSVETFRKIMEYYEYERITICSITRSGHRELDVAANPKALYIKAKLNALRPDSCFVYGSPLNFYDERDTADGYLSQVSELYDMGVDGYKMLDGKPELRKNLGHSLCDPIFDKMYAFMEEKGLPLKMHLGDPAKYWGKKELLSEYAISRGWWYGDGTYPSLSQLRDEIDGILTKFPKLKLCLAHFFFLGDELEKAEAFFEKWENVAFDLTPGASMFLGFSARLPEWKEFFSKYRNRIFFGSDTYNTSFGDNYEGVSGGRINQVRKMLEKPTSEGFEIPSIGFVTPMDLEDDILRCIYIDNHKTLHPTARALNSELIVKKAKELSEKIKNGELSYKEPEEIPLELSNLETVEKYFSENL